jgi:endonuclease YncB( thermonuclease family)
MGSRVLIILLVMLLLPWQAQAAGHQGEVQGRVVGVHDGDTFTLLQDGNHQTKVRLAEIDAPESKQPYGNKAKLELSSLIFGKTVTVKIQDIDRYGRTVGRVFIDTMDVNADMIRRGAAWVYRKYAKDQTLFPLEAQAQQDQRGLWSLPDSERIPPWEWRHPKSGITSTRTPDTSQNTPSSQRGEGFTCGEKRTCGQMTSCAEARFYLQTCGVSSLDGNHDGTPCSKLCR